MDTKAWSEMDDHEKMAWLKEQVDGQMAASEELAKKHPNMHPMTLMVMAGDIAFARKAEAAFLAGELDFRTALSRMGSYARFDFVVRMLEAGRVTEQDVYPILPHEWSMADPDDTEPRYLALWFRAWVANGEKMIVSLHEGEALPAVFQNNRLRLIPIYRGVPLGGSRHGFAWSLSKDVATRFAKGAGSRVPTEGDVFFSKVHRNHILAYIGDRMEAEVILDPNNLIFPPKIVESWRFERKLPE